MSWLELAAMVHVIEGIVAGVVALGTLAFLGYLHLRDSRQ